MNERIHPLLKQMKNAILDTIAPKQKKIITAKEANALKEVLVWINKYENKDFDGSNSNVFDYILNLNKKIIDFTVKINNQNNKYMVYDEDDLIVEIRNCLEKLQNSIEDNQLQDLSQAKKMKLSSREIQDGIYNIQEQLYEYKKQLKNYEQELVDKKSYIEGLELNVKNKFKDIEKQQDEFGKKIKLKQNKIQEELNKVLSDIYEEELAAYFHNERKSLKGDIAPYTILLAIVLDIILTSRMFSLQELEFKYLPENIFVVIVALGIFLVTIISTELLFEIIKNKVNNKGCVFKINFKLKTFNGLMTPFWCWLIGVFFGMGSIFIIALERYAQINNEVVTMDKYLNNIIPSLPLCLILIWFTWFCSKQFSYTKQICDEYEYKYALSKSYLSYRDEAKKLADNTKIEALLVALLDSVIKNIATSPVQSVRSDCHTPFSEVLGVLKETIKKE